MPCGEPGWRCGQPYGHEALCLQGGSPDLRVPLPQRHGGSQAQRLVGGWMAGLSLSPGFAPPPSPWWALAQNMAARAWLTLLGQRGESGPPPAPQAPSHLSLGVQRSPSSRPALGVPAGQDPNPLVGWDLHPSPCQVFQWGRPQSPAVGQASTPSGFGPAPPSGADPSLLARQTPIPRGADPDSHCSRPSPRVGQTPPPPPFPLWGIANLLCGSPRHPLWV